MKIRGNPALWAACCALAVEAASGCSVAQGCSSAGAGSAIFLKVAAGALPEAGTATRRVCAGSVCTYRLPRLPFPSIAVGMTSLTSSATVVSVEVRQGSHLIFIARTIAHTRKYQPNGPGCGPTVWHAKVTLQPGNRLVDAS